MPSNYTGNPANIADQRAAPIVADPIDSDAATAASVASIFNKLADEIAELKKTVAYLSGVANPSATAAQPGITATGNTTGAGVSGTGGASSGQGVLGQGGATNGIGVEGVGAGTGAGVYGQGGASDGSGVTGTGAGAGSGVKGSGGTSGAGGSFLGNANRGALNLTPQANPAAAVDGDIWLGTDNILHVQIAGLTRNITVT